MFMNTDSDPALFEPFGEDEELTNRAKQALPNCIEIGIRASKRGDFSTARQMLRSAIDQIENDLRKSAASDTHKDIDTDNKRSNTGKIDRLLELMTSIADTYLNESDYGQAKNLYEKTAERCVAEIGIASSQFACLMVRLAEVGILQSRLNDFQTYLQKAQQTYLLTKELNTASLLNALTDLSWALCVKGYLIEVVPVNNLIMQIKQVDKETAYTSILDL